MNVQYLNKTLYQWSYSLINTNNTLSFMCGSLPSSFDFCFIISIDWALVSDGG